MRRLLTALMAIAAACGIAAFIAGPTESSYAQPITTGGGLNRVVHSGVFYGLGTTGTPLDLRHDCTSGSGLGWSGSSWDCVAASGASVGSANAGSGLSATGAVLNVGSTTGGMIAIGADTIGLDGSGCGSGQVPVWGGATWACGTVASGSGSLGSGSISIATATATTPVNLSTTGTIDWIASVAASTGATRLAACTATTSTNCRMKKTGAGQLLAPGLDWMGTCATGGTGTGLVTFTSTATDDMNLSALSSAQISYCAQATANSSGFRYVLPSAGGNATRVARIWVYQYDSTVTCTATAVDGTSPGSNASTSTGSGGITSEYLYTISYSTNTAQPVVVNCVESASLTGTGTPNMGWGAATLGTI